MQEFLQTLTEEERMLLVLKTELYEGRWDEMLTDLRQRQKGKPYIFKLVNRIADDIARIERMRSFEEEHGVDLAQLVADEQTS